MWKSFLLRCSERQLLSLVAPHDFEKRTCVGELQNICAGSGADLVLASGFPELIPQFSQAAVACVRVLLTVRSCMPQRATSSVKCDLQHGEDIFIHINL